MTPQEDQLARELELVAKIRLAGEAARAAKRERREKARDDLKWGGLPPSVRDMSIGGGRDE